MTRINDVQVFVKDTLALYRAIIVAKNY
jgi:hypothetical protein